MSFDIEYKNKQYKLCDDFIDIGYMAENFEALDINEESFEFKRSNPDRSMSLLISFPDLQQQFAQEILKIDTLLSALEVTVHCYLVFNEANEQYKEFQKSLNKLQILFDHEEEFGNMYGTKIINDDLEDKLTKALFLISKDGSVFYLQMPKDLSQPLDLERLRIELNKAYVTYTGVGCHG